MIKRILVIFFGTVALLCISATTLLWANAYDGVYIFKNMDSTSVQYHVLLGSITFIFSTGVIRVLWSVLNTAHEEEMSEIHKLG